MDEDEPLFLFTSGHEIGHWILHRHRDVLIGNKNNHFDDLETDIKWKWRLNTPKDWAEHQANVFSASLTMPRRAILRAVVKIQKEIGITRKLGKIYVDDQWCNKKDFINILSGLQRIFGTSKQALRIRLIEANILFEEGGIKQLGEINEEMKFKIYT